MAAIKCLTFDLDDTLWNIRPVIENMDNKLYDWLTRYAPMYSKKFSIDYLQELREFVLTEHPEIAHSVTLVRKKALQIGLKNAGYDEASSLNLALQGFEVALVARQEVSFFPHVLPSLQRLKEQGYLIGAITNGNADVHRVGLSEYFDFQFSAHDAGVEKPDPFIYQMMLDHTGLKPHEIIHIGDNPIADIKGAQELGMSTIWVNVVSQEWKEDFYADVQIDCISELNTAVSSIVMNIEERA